MKSAGVLVFTAVLVFSAAAAQAASGSLQGDTAISTNGKVTRIAIDTHGGASKGVADYGFVFASEITPPFMNVLLPNAHLEFSSSRLTVISASTQSILIFELTGTPADDRVIPPPFTLTRFVGYQLAWHDLRDRNITLDYVLGRTSGGIHPNLIQTIDYPGDDWGGGGGGGAMEPTCSSGGRGCTECSIEWEIQGATVTYKRSCTAKCATGYYACCNDYSCKCYAY